MALPFIFKGNLAEGVKLAKAALVNGFNDPDVLFWCSWMLMMTGKFSYILPIIETAIKIDPLNPLHYMTKGAAEFFNGKFDLGVKYCSKAHKMQPDNPMLTFWYTICLAYAGKKEDAINILDNHLNLQQSNPDNFTQQAYFLKLILTGEKDKISQLESFFVNAKYDLQHSYHNGCFYAYINEKKQALDWLDNAVNKGFSIYPLINKYDPFLKNIRGENKFQELMKRVKEQWENFQASLPELKT